MKIGRILVVVFFVLLAAVTISSCDTKEPEENIGLQQPVQESTIQQERVGDAVPVAPPVAVEENDEDPEESDDENAPTDEEDIDPADEGEDDEDMDDEDMDAQDTDDEDMDDEDLDDEDAEIEQPEKVN